MTNLTVTQKFEYLETFTKMTLDKISNGLLVTGKGGIGKSHTVLKAASNYSNVKVIKGSCTPKAFFNILSENRNATIIFDDCDEILVNKKSFDLIKAAIDSGDNRVVSWLAHNSKEESFEFKGSLIFISNLELNDVDQAIRTRCLNIELSMTDSEKIDRLYHIVGNGEFLPNVSFNDKFEALEFVSLNIGKANNFSIRSLIQIVQIKLTMKTGWEQAALYALQSGQ